MQDPRSVFSEQEVSKILQRAVELAESQKESYVPGITHEELSTIANEVGIPSAALSAALEEHLANKNRGTAGKNEPESRVVDGEVDPADFDILTEHLRPMHNQHQAGLSQVGRSVTCTSWIGATMAKVEVYSRDGRTRLKVAPSLAFPILYSIYPAGIVALMSGLALGNAGQSILAALSTIGTLGLGAFAYWRLIKAARNQAHDLANRLSGVVRDYVATKRAKEQQMQERLSNTTAPQTARQESTDQTVQN